MPGAIRQVIVNFLLGLAAIHGTDFTQALRRAIDTEQFINKHISSGGRILLKKNNILREVEYR